MSLNLMRRIITLTQRAFIKFLGCERYWSRLLVRGGGGWLEMHKDEQNPSFKGSERGINKVLCGRLEQSGLGNQLGCLLLLPISSEKGIDFYKFTCQLFIVIAMCTLYVEFSR